MKKIFCVLGCALIAVCQTLAQEAPSMFALYRDNVKPSKNAQYREGVKKLKAACEQNKLAFRWTTYAFDDNSYYHVVPIKAFSELDNKPFAPLAEKLGKEAMASLWNTIQQCVESQSSSVIVRLTSLSYLEPTAEDRFLEVTSWQVDTDKAGDAEKILAEWKQLNTAKNTPSGFTAYKIVFGAELGYFVNSWGKSIFDWADKEQKSNQLLGEEGDKMWQKTLSITRKYDSHKAWRQPDLSYVPQ